MVGLFLETHNTECYNQDVKRSVDRPAILLNRDKVHLIMFRSIRLKINRCCVKSLAQYISHGKYYLATFAWSILQNDLVGKLNLVIACMYVCY